LKPSGSRLWRFKYQLDGREKLIGLGHYPEVPLKEARERRDEARRLLASSVDPAEKRKAERLALPDTFEAIAREFLTLKSKTLDPGTLALKTARLESFIFPRFGTDPIRKVTPPQLLRALRAIEERGRHETAHRVRAQCSEVFRYAVATGRAEHDVAADLRSALAPVNVRNRAAITEPTKIGELMRAIHGYQGQPSTEFALKLLPLVFVRPSELRNAEWVEFDLKNGLWRIPGPRMKMRDPHIVPLSRQSQELITNLQLINGRSRYCVDGSGSGPIKRTTEGWYCASPRTRSSSTRSKPCSACMASMKERTSGRDRYSVLASAAGVTSSAASAAPERTSRAARKNRIGICELSRRNVAKHSSTRNHARWMTFTL
jgi:integrase